MEKVPSEHFPGDPTATEVAEELRQRRERAERVEEMRRRAEWDAAHPPQHPVEQQAEFDRGLGEIEAVSEEDVEVDE